MLVGAARASVIWNNRFESCRGKVLSSLDSRKRELPDSIPMPRSAIMMCEWPRWIGTGLQPQARRFESGFALCCLCTTGSNRTTRRRKRLAIPSEADLVKAVVCEATHEGSIPSGGTRSRGLCGLSVRVCPPLRGPGLKNSETREWGCSSVVERRAGSALAGSSNLPSST